jgi:transcriptional regulator with XRE-family HTH domain
MPSASALALGKAIAKLRNSKGLRQKEVVARIPTVYSDVNAYGRVERGERHPDRDDVLAILIHGLLVTSPAEIDPVLALGGYAGLIDSEIQSLKLSQAATDRARKSQVHSLFQRVREPLWRTGSMLVAAVTAVCVFIALRWAGDEALFIILSSSVYAALYVISLLLESTFQSDQRGIPGASIFVFCFILFTSTVALTMDAYLVGVGSRQGLLMSLFVFIAAAIGQWMLTRSTLADEAVVPTTYPSHTAQAAHLKNTMYFLGIVVIYWAPPAHAVAVLQREVHLGRTIRTRELAGHFVLIGLNMISLNVNFMLVVFAAMVIYALIARVKLLDNLMPARSRNRYVALYYWRVTVYFLLVLGCIGWFADAVAAL